MILTTCAACAAPLAHDAPRCVRCKLRYCDSTCQHDHWRRGHKQMCKKIHRGGNAEQYNADKKYKEAIAVAVAALRARESPLPSPWEAHRSEEGALYFYNRETGESEWTLPDELLARETPHRVRS